MILRLPYRRTAETAALLSLIMLCLLAVPSAASSSPDHLVRKIVDEVGARRSDFMRLLSLLPVNENACRGYESEGSPQKDLLKARAVISREMAKALGEQRVSLQSFDVGGSNGVNIIGTMPGCGARRGRTIVLNAHYDSVQNAGADDNGSGVAGLLLLAGIFSHHRFDETIVFIAFDQEEECGSEDRWGRGSRFYAEKAKNEGRVIDGAVSIDAIAYNHSGKNTGSLSRPDLKRGSPSARLLSDIAQAFLDYTELDMKAMMEEDSSDPYRFYKAGFPAVLVSEQFDSGGWPVNPYYHTEDDYYLTSSGKPHMCGGRKYIDQAYAVSILQGVAGWLARAAGVLD
jgi:hypothetical protein